MNNMAEWIRYEPADIESDRGKETCSAARVEELLKEELQSGK